MQTLSLELSLGVIVGGSRNNGYLSEGIVRGIDEGT